MADGSIMAGASCETLGALSSGTRIACLEYQNCPKNQRKRKMRLQCAYFDLFFSNSGSRLKRNGQNENLRILQTLEIPAKAGVIWEARTGLGITQTLA